jgi:hypothetical protein
VHMCTYRILTLHSSFNVSQWKGIFAKLHGAPVESCGSVCLKNCCETLDQKWMVRILYVYICTKSPCVHDMFPSKKSSPIAPINNSHIYFPPKLNSFVDRNKRSLRSNTILSKYCGPKC